MKNRKPWEPVKRTKVKRKRQYKGTKRPTVVSKVYQADETLVSISGMKEATRGQFVKGVWAYIKANKLQKPGDGRIVIPNAKLANLMGEVGKEIDGFQMLRYIEQHLVKTQPQAEADPGQTQGDPDPNPLADKSETQSAPDSKPSDDSAKKEIPDGKTNPEP